MRRDSADYGEFVEDRGDEGQQLFVSQSCDERKVTTQRVSAAEWRIFSSYKATGCHSHSVPAVLLEGDKGLPEYVGQVLFEDALTRRREDGEGWQRGGRFGRGG